MSFKLAIICLSALFAACQGGLVPALPAAYFSTPYASSYSASVVNHAVAAPLAAAPLVAAAPAPYPAYPYAAAFGAPLVAGK